MADFPTTWQPDLPGGGPRPAGPLTAGTSGAAGAPGAARAAVLREVDRAGNVQTENISVSNKTAGCLSAPTSYKYIIVNNLSS